MESSSPIPIIIIAMESSTESNCDERHELRMETVVNHTDIDDTNTNLANTKTKRKQRIAQYTPYNAFASNYFKTQENMSRKTFGEISKHASIAWKEISEADKEVYAKQAEQKQNAMQELTLSKDKKQYQCSKCSAQIRFHKNLTLHEKECGQSFSCHLCNKSLSSSANLKQHIKSVHEKLKPYSCETCNSAFYLQKDLDRHQAVHRKGTGFICQVCKATFSFKSNLKRHMTKQH